MFIDPYTEIKKIYISLNSKGQVTEVKILAFFVRLLSRPQKFLCFFYFEGNEMRKTIFVYGQRLNKH